MKRGAFIHDSLSRASAGHFVRRARHSALRAFPSGLIPAAPRYHGRVYNPPKPGYDPETMRAVALAYRRERQAGRLDEPPREGPTGVPGSAPRARTHVGERSRGTHHRLGRPRALRTVLEGVGLPERR